MTAQEKLIKLYQEAEQKLTAIILDKQSHGRAFMYELSLLQQVQQELNKLKKDSHAVVGELVRNNYQKGLTELVMEAQAAGMDPQSAGMLMMSGLNTSQIELLIENTDYDFNRAIHLVGRRMQDGIREAAIEAAAEKLTTGQTVRQMQKILEQKLAAQGLTSVEYANGMQMPLSSYAEMVSRSTTAETQNAAKIVQGGAWGYELVTMTTHSPTCAICAMYQGRVYATTKEAANGKYRTKNGTVLRFPYLYDTAFASGYDTIHPNCRHRIALFAWEAYTEEELRHYQNVSNAPFEDTRSDQERKAYAAAVAKRRQLLANRRQYLKIKEALPNDAPKSFAGFMRMKNANSERYRNLMRDYRQIKRISDVQDTMTEQVKTLSEEEQGILREYSGALASRLNAAIGRGKLTPELETNLNP
ncbi:MAG: phage minor capsid protein, partial [Acutalibacteraceae bacterium]|nr:phage minor capsid protein [Acutalibacteraceae bacterium]